MGRMRYRVRGPRHVRPYRRSAAPTRPAPDSYPATEPRQVPAPYSVVAWPRPRRAAAAASLAVRWLAVAILCLAVLDVARVAGVPIVLIVLIWTGSVVARGRRRRLLGRLWYRGPDTRDGPAPSSTIPPTVAQTEPPKPDRGNPYDLETYLRRHAEERP